MQLIGFLISASKIKMPLIKLWMLLTRLTSLFGRWVPGFVLTVFCDGRSNIFVNTRLPPDSLNKVTICSKHIRLARKAVGRMRVALKSTRACKNDCVTHLRACDERLIVPVGIGQIVARSTRHLCKYNGWLHVSVVRTSVSGRQTFPAIRPIYG